MVEVKDAGHRRVVIVNQFAVTPIDAGGTRHFDLGRQLAARGWKVIVVASDYHLHARRYVRRASSCDRSVHSESYGGLSFLWLWAYPYLSNDWRRVANWLTFAWQVVSRLWTREQPTIVLGSSPSLFAACAGWILTLRWKVPFVLEVRDLWPESLHAVGGPGRAMTWPLSLLARFLYRRAERIVVVTEGMNAALVAAGVNRQHIVCIPNGVEPGMFGDLQRPARGTVNLIYAGAHGAANGLDVVVEAASILKTRPEIRFTLVGDGQAKAALQAVCTAKSLANVTFIDPVSKQDLGRLFVEADAGLMVLKDARLFSQGASPNKLFDYWASGLPVVCNVDGELAGVMARSDGGVQAAGPSAEQLAQAIMHLAAMTPEERQALGAAGRRWVMEERSRDKLAVTLNALLDEVISERQGRGPTSSGTGWAHQVGGQA